MFADVSSRLSYSRVFDSDDIRRLSRHDALGVDESFLLRRLVALHHAIEKGGSFIADAMGVRLYTGHRRI